ncbi:hypothetical protein PHLGIDRAFT_125810 [Phlebiopsis gigantea 11061_1 CR5-6]|uniref:Copper transporter n=1 Tax=Phlebiopsis gigantea (strain 11061_1 CR5-6) TaxID=745531 RepID=A0A0C3S3M2_PHLG1|nr:hypothetical protein PHLGIDRAFT_125810 [Phlebiopsis gigantea 11061_1 CR5-6]
MQMDGWTDHLHIDLFGEHVLFPSLRLDSAWHFILASALTILLCLIERTLTYAISKNWTPFKWTRRSRLSRAMWRSFLYWIVTLDRLLYMLVAMTFSLGLIFVTVTSLSIGQFVIEYLDGHENEKLGHDVETVKELLLSSSPTSYESNFALHPYNTYQPSTSRYTHSSSSSSSSLYLANEDNSIPLPTTTAKASSSQSDPIKRPRSKSKPTSIFIHPNESNLARADAAALQLGITGDTELVKGNMHSTDGDAAWKMGEGKDLARQIMTRGGTM